MKIITWNCQGAFRKKAAQLLKLRPDVLVIQECEHPSKLLFHPDSKKPDCTLWFGDNPHKGIGIFSYNKYQLKVADDYNPSFKIIVPVVVESASQTYTLFAIWANNPQDKKNQYIGQVWKAIKHYNKLLDRGTILLAGDFNSNKIWDRPNRIANHSAVVEMLAAKKIHSLYHRHYSQEQGREKHPTFYLHRNQEKPYHLDYIFATNDVLSGVTKFAIGTYKKWITHSDHSPLIVDFILPK